MRVIMIGNRMYAAYKAWRKMRREQFQEQLRKDFYELVEMTLAKSR